jgi:hypothetical protein
LHRNYLLKYLIEGKVVERRRSKKLLDDLKEKTDTGNLKRKRYITFSGQLALEKTTEFPYDRLQYGE